MGAARLEYITLFLAAAAYLLQPGHNVTLLELFIFFGLGASIYEFFSYKLKRKIIVWPSDRDNGQAIMDSLASNETIDDIMHLEFGAISDDLLEKFRFVTRPGMQAQRFHDSDLGASYRYLREKVVELMAIIDSEMFIGEVGFKGLKLPIEWKAEPRGSYLRLRYREAQKDLLKRSKEVVVAINAFADCFQGASYRV